MKQRPRHHASRAGWVHGDFWVAANGYKFPLRKSPIGSDVRLAYIWPMFADFLSRLIRPEPETLDDADARLALTALLVRLARSDGEYARQEIARIRAIAAARFGLDDNAAGALLAQAEQLEAEAPDTVRFTRAIKDAVPYDQRTGVVEALWQVALADGERDAGEDALIRLAASFLGVSDRDSALARQKAAKA